MQWVPWPWPSCGFVPATKVGRAARRQAAGDWDAAGAMLADEARRLEAAGAEAVAVNGLRLGPGTFIRTAGSTILVNVTALKSPYEVEAIGDANALQVALVRGGTGDYLSAAKSVRSSGVGSSADKSLTLEGLDSSTTRYATPVDNSSGG